MAKIKQKLDFSESVFIEKQVINNISYNSSISSFNRSKVVIENFLTKEIREIRKSEQDCFNPKPNYKGVFSIIDHSKYNVYFIDSSIANGKIGGSLLIDNEEKENIYYYADFCFTLIDPSCFIKKMMKNEKLSYISRFDINLNVGQNMRPLIEKVLIKYIEKNGLRKITTYKSRIIEEINDELIDDKTFNLGIKVEIIDFNLKSEISK